MNIKTKFDIGDLVFFMHDNTITSDYVRKMTIHVDSAQNHIKYEMTDHYKYQEHVFDTLPDLIKNLQENAVAYE